VDFDARTKLHLSDCLSDRDHSGKHGRALQRSSDHHDGKIQCVHWLLVSKVSIRGDQDAEAVLGHACQESAIPETAPTFTSD